VWSTIQDSEASKIGLRQGDRLVSINGSPIGSFYWLNLKLGALGFEPFTLAWRSRDGSEHTARLNQVPREERDLLNAKHSLPDPGFRPSRAFSSNDDVLSAGPKLDLLKVTNGPKAALLASMAEVPRAVSKIAQVMKGFGTGKIGFENVGGPIMLAQIAAKSAEAGLDVFLSNMALVSVNLALVNLLPIPVLDGFGLVAAFWEGIRRRPIPARAREMANVFGLVVLAMLVVRVFYNDIMRSFGLD
jgi:regulator of sigma E protease